MFSAFKNIKYNWNRLNDKLWNFHTFVLIDNYINERVNQKVHDDDLLAMMKQQAKAVETFGKSSTTNNLDEMEEDAESPMEYNIQHHVLEPMPQ